MSSTAPSLDDDDLDESCFPSTEPDPPLTEGAEIRQVNTGWLKPHELSVGIYGEASADQELVASVKERGILTPLQVTPAGTVISGHRRLEAAKEARLETVPVYVINPKGNRVGDLEEQILEANRQRKKDTEQVIREFMAYKMIETARAKQRCGCRWDLVPKSASGEDVMPAPDECIYPLTTLKQEVGKARDLAAKKVGLSVSTAAMGEKVVEVIDRFWAESGSWKIGQLQEFLEFRRILNEKSINAAHREAIQKGWLPALTKRKANRAGADVESAPHAGQEDNGQDLEPAGPQSLVSVPPAGEHGGVEADSAKTLDPERDVAVAGVGTTEAVAAACAEPPLAPEIPTASGQRSDAPVDVRVAAGQQRDDVSVVKPGNAPIQARELSGPPASAEAPVAVPATESPLNVANDAPSPMTVPQAEAVPAVTEIAHRAEQPPQPTGETDSSFEVRDPIRSSGSDALDRSSTRVNASNATPATETQPARHGGGDLPVVVGHELVPPEKVQKAVGAVRPSDLRSSDGSALTESVRRAIPLVAQTLAQYSHQFPELEGRDLCLVFSMANTKLQVAMGWL